MGVEVAVVQRSWDKEMSALFTAPVRVAEAHMALDHQRSVRDQRLALSDCNVNMLDAEWLSPPVEVNFRALGNRLSHVVAGILGTPLEHPCCVVKSVGRLAVIDYTVIGGDDPDLLVWWGSGARSFHDAVMRFQREREYGGYYPAEWYRSVKAAGHAMLNTLLRLSPHFLEFDFAATWVLDVCTFHHRIY